MYIFEKRQKNRLSEADIQDIASELNSALRTKRSRTVGLNGPVTKSIKQRPDGKVTVKVVYTVNPMDIFNGRDEIFDGEDVKEFMDMYKDILERNPDMGNYIENTGSDLAHNYIGNIRSSYPAEREPKMKLPVELVLRKDYFAEFGPEEVVEEIVEDLKYHLADLTSRMADMHEEIVDRILDNV